MQFEDICKDNYVKIYNYVLAKTGSKETAEDVTQEVFLIACRNKKRLLHHEKPLAFLYVTAKNLVMEYFRQSKKVDISNEIEPKSNCRDVFEQLCYEKDQLIDENSYRNKIIQELSEQERTLYQEYYINKKTMKIIAEEWGISEVAIRMKYVRIRKKVQRIVAGLKLGDF